MIHIDEVIVVEGKYDKERLRRVTDAPIICTHGFELYRSKRIIETLRELSRQRGIIVLTDSDRAGFRIRNYIKRCLGKDARVRHAYIPHIAGKEKRKEKPGADGLLGVEGMTDEVLEKILKRLSHADDTKLTAVTKSEFYADGFAGKPDSAERRRRLALRLSLPPSLSSNALLDMINKTYGAEKYREAASDITKD